MPSAVGGFNTPHVGEEYYHIPLCGGLACNLFCDPLAKAPNTFTYIQIKRKSRLKTSACQTAKDGDDAIGFLMHKEIENKVPQW
jgi:hypothetical protein